MYIKYKGFLKFIIKAQEDMNIITHVFTARIQISTYIFIASFFFCLTRRIYSRVDSKDKLERNAIFCQNKCFQKLMLMGTTTTTTSVSINTYSDSDYKVKGL